MNLIYAIPSYGRPEGIKTLDYLSKAKMYVSPEDYPKYIEKNPQHKDRIIQVPEGVQGKGKGRAMNWILDNLWADDVDGIMILDDDITCLMGHSPHGTTDYKIDEQMFYELAEDFSLLAKEWGCGLWSYSLNCDKLSYTEFRPFKTHSYLTGALQGFVRNDGLRFDEELTLKEDVDMFLQQLQKYHKALRVDKYYFNVKAFEGVGGCQAFRNSDEEKRQFVMMQEKWGKDIIRPNRPKAEKDSGIRGMGGAIKLNIPLDGI